MSLIDSVTRAEYVDLASRIQRPDILSHPCTFKINALERGLTSQCVMFCFSSAIQCCLCKIDEKLDAINYSVDKCSSTDCDFLCRERVFNESVCIVRKLLSVQNRKWQSGIDEGTTGAQMCYATNAVCVCVMHLPTKESPIYEWFPHKSYLQEYARHVEKDSYYIRWCERTKENNRMRHYREANCRFVKFERVKVFGLSILATEMRGPYFRPDYCSS